MQHAYALKVASLMLWGSMDKGIRLIPLLGMMQDILAQRASHSLWMIGIVARASVYFDISPWL
jgi:hypothetical protein